MGEIWPTVHVTELSLHSLPAQGLETEMSTALQTQSCETALLTMGDLPLHSHPQTIHPLAPPDGYKNTMIRMANNLN